MATGLAHCATAVCATALCAAAGASPPPNQWGYAYDDSYDAVKAAPDVHRLRYEDEHIQFLEVANPPGYHMQMHGHPYPSVFARSSSGVIVNGLAPKERFLDPASKLNGQDWRQGPSPNGAEFPTCTAANPQAPHLPVNGSDTPLHFYRVEFKRVDQDDLVKLKWRYAQAPLQQVRFEDAAVRLTEETLAPGQSEPPANEPYSAVLAFDTINSFDAVSQSAGPGSGRSEPPHGMVMPRCIDTAPNALRGLTNRSALPIHYYRVDFKRVDGPELHDHWREWYPYMLQMK